MLVWRLGCSSIVGGQRHLDRGQQSDEPKKIITYQLKDQRLPDLGPPKSCRASTVYDTSGRTS